MTRRGIPTLLTLLLCISLAACHTGMDAGISTSVMTSDISSAQVDTASSALVTADVSTVLEHSADAAQATAAASTTQPNNTTQSKPTATKTMAAASNTTTTGKKPQATQTVSIIIQCQTAVQYGIRQDAGYAQIIPESGILLEHAAFPFTQGESVLAIVKRALQEAGMLIQERGGYVRAIGGLPEKACGGTSGWLYFVNGEMPPISSTGYYPRHADRIVFAYTVEPGDATPVS